MIHALSWIFSTCVLDSVLLSTDQCTVVAELQVCFNTRDLSLGIETGGKACHMSLKLKRELTKATMDFFGKGSKQAPDAAWVWESWQHAEEVSGDDDASKFKKWGGLVHFSAGDQIFYLSSQWLLNYFFFLRTELSIITTTDNRPPLIKWNRDSWNFTMETQQTTYQSGVARIYRWNRDNGSSITAKI